MEIHKVAAVVGWMQVKQRDHLLGQCALSWKVTLTLVLSLMTTVNPSQGNLTFFNQGQTIHFWREETQRVSPLKSSPPWHFSAFTVSRNSIEAY